MEELKQKSTSTSVPQAPTPHVYEPIRLHKFLAQCGFGSRRQCEDFIRAGRVRVNGSIVQEMGVKIVPGQDRVEVDGKLVRSDREPLVYYLLHKPKGYLTTRRDERGRQTIYELLKHIPQRVFPVGRLDRDSEGLLLLTNDGALAHRLMHPAFRVEKEYWVEVEGYVSDDAIEQLESGVVFEGEAYQPARVQVCSRGPERSFLNIIIREGKKRQIRRMCQAVGHPVRRLVRVREGSLVLGDLPVGKVRPLRREEVTILLQEAGLNKAEG